MARCDYSYLSISTGFEFAAFRVWERTVRMPITNTIKIPAKTVPAPNET